MTTNSKKEFKKRKKITIRHTNENITLYLLFVNLMGFHDKIYKLRWNGDCERWVDSSGNMDICIGESFGINYYDEMVKYITPDKQEAEIILEFSKALLTHLKNRI